MRRKVFVVVIKCQDPYWEEYVVTSEGNLRNFLYMSPDLVGDYHRKPVIFEDRNAAVQEFEKKFPDWRKRVDEYYGCEDAELEVREVFADECVLCGTEFYTTSTAATLCSECRDLATFAFRISRKVAELERRISLLEKKKTGGK